MNSTNKPEILPPVIDRKDRVFAYQILQGVFANPDITASQKESLSWAIDTIGNNLQFKELSSNNGVTIFGHPYNVHDISRQIQYTTKDDGTLLIEYGSAADAKIYDSNETIVASIHTFKHKGDREARVHHHGNKNNPRDDISLRQLEKAQPCSCPSCNPSNVSLENPFRVNQLQVA